MVIHIRRIAAGDQTSLAVAAVEIGDKGIWPARAGDGHGDIRQAFTEIVRAIVVQVVEDRAADAAGRGKAEIGGRAAVGRYGDRRRVSADGERRASRYVAISFSDVDGVAAGDEIRLTVAARSIGRQIIGATRTGDRDGDVSQTFARIGRIIPVQVLEDDARDAAGA